MRNLDSIFDGAEKTAPNPFREDVFASGITPLPGVTEIHGEAMSRCIRAFESLLTERGAAASPWGGSGRTLLIAAPRAGFGKSHLIGRVRAVTENLIAPLALPFDPARKVAWETMLVSIFNQYRSARCPQHTGCSLFDETARFFQSQMVRSAIELGVIDEKEIPEKEVALRLQFRDVFDPKASTRMVPWLTKRSPEIMDAVAIGLGKRWQLEFDDLVFWNRFFQDASRPKSTAFEQLVSLENATARDRLTQFLRIASDCRPVAFIADHLDGFFGSSNAGMQIAEILTDLRFSVPRSVTLLCLNEDVWDSIFEGKIPSAWIDRLTGDAAPLVEMSVEEAEAVLIGRLRQAGHSTEDAETWVRRHQGTCFEAGNDGLYPREVLRRAAREWDRDALSRAEPTAPLIPEKSETHREPVIATPPLPENFSDIAPSDDHEDQRNVFSAPDSTPPSPPTPTPPPIPAPQPAPERQTQLQQPPAPRAGDEHTSAAARAAGIDPSQGLPSIHAIINEIRGGGARALSETQSASGTDVPSRHQMPFSPPPSEEGMDHFDGAAGVKSEPAHPMPQSPPPGGVPVNPFWAQSCDNRLRELEHEILANSPAGKPEWQPHRLYRVIQAVGAQFPAVAQTTETIEHRPSLTWEVRGSAVRIGFEAPEHFSYWSHVIDSAVQSLVPGKVVLFSHPIAPFNYEALSAMGADDSTAMRFLDIVEMSDVELARVYAAEKFLDEANRQEQFDHALRIVARHLDSFWRRIGQPLKNAGAAG